MPPGPPNKRQTTASSSRRSLPRTRLNGEQISDLHHQFTQHRQQLPCPICKEQGRISKRGYTSDLKRQPLFECQACKKQLNHDLLLTTLDPLIKDSRKRAKTNQDNAHAPSPIEPPVTLTANEAETPQEYDEPSWADQMNTEEATPLRLLTFEHHEALPDYMQQLTEQINGLTNRVNQQDHIMAELQHITARLSEVTSELTRAHTRIEELEHENATLREQLTEPQLTSKPTEIETSSASKYATNPSQNTNLAGNQHNNPWSQPERLRHLKTKPTKKASPATVLRRQQAAARAFMPPSPTQGFCITYFPNRSRLPTSQTRANLRRLGIDNSRVLDIHYPDRKVVGLLTHNDYVADMISVFDTHGITRLTNYDPCDPKHLQDPKLKDLTPEERTAKAISIQHNRILNAIDFIRTPVKLAVAYDFHQKQLLSEEELQRARKGERLAPKRIKETNNTDRRLAADAFRPDMEDANMEELDSLSHITTPPTSPRTTTTIISSQ